MKLKSNEMRSLFSAIHADKATTEQKKELNEIVKEIFGEDGRNVFTTPALEQFNALIVETADVVAKEKIDQMLNLLADVKQRGLSDEVYIKKPQLQHADFVLAATGSAPHLIRVGSQASIKAARETAQVGFSYNPRDLIRESVETFNDLVAELAERKVQYLWARIEEVIKGGLNGLIPVTNVVQGAPLTIKDFNKLAGRLSRFGQKPLLVADPLLIQSLAEQDLTRVSDGEKSAIAHDIVVEKVGRAVAAPIVNPFVDEDNSKVAFDVTTGYMMAQGASGHKPIQINLYGDMFQAGNTKWENGEVQFYANFEYGVNMIQTRYIGVVKDTSIQL